MSFLTEFRTISVIASLVTCCGIAFSKSLEPEYSRSEGKGQILDCALFGRDPEQSYGQHPLVRFCRTTEYLIVNRQVEARSKCQIIALDTQRAYNQSIDRNANILFLFHQGNWSAEPMERFYCSGYGTPCQIRSKIWQCHEGEMGLVFAFQNDLHYGHRNNHGENYQATIPPAD